MARGSAFTPAPRCARPALGPRARSSPAHPNPPHAPLPAPAHQDGFSFNRLSHAVKGYGGPTLTIIQDESGAVFGGYADVGWKASNGFFGSQNCFLFRLAPDFEIFRSRIPSDGNFMVSAFLGTLEIPLDGGYLPPPPLSTPNTRTHPVQYFNEAGFSLPHGIGFGGSLTDSFRLFIPESLESCTARGRCLTYEPGRLTGMSPTTPGGADFQLASLEVWGCGDAECLLRAQEAQAAASSGG